MDAQVTMGLAVALVLLCLAAAGIFADARRRGPAVEACFWCLGCLLLFPVAFPIYVCRAYCSPRHTTTPIALLPWSRAAAYLATLMFLTLLSGCIGWIGNLALPWLSLPEGAGYEFVMASIVAAPIYIGGTYAFRRLVDRRSPASLGTPMEPGRIARDSAAGALAGCAAVGAGMAALAVVGVARIEAEGDAGPFCALLVPVYLAGFAEEIVLRGYLLRNMAVASNRTVAVVATSLLFGVAHSANPGFSWLGLANVCLVGVLLAIAVLITDRLWFAAGLHWAWNLVLGPVFGTPVSGLPVSGLLRTSLSGPHVLSGGEFGFEGSLAATAVVCGAILVALTVLRRRCEFSEPPDDTPTGPTAQHDG